MAKESGEPNMIFYQLISERKLVLKMDIFTDGSRLTKIIDVKWDVLFTFKLNVTCKYKLNPITSSFITKTFAVDKALD